MSGRHIAMQYALASSQPVSGCTMTSRLHLFAASLLLVCASVAHAEMVVDHTNPAALIWGSGDSGIYLQSLAAGQDGGNQIKFEARRNYPYSSGVSPLYVDTNANLIVIFLATDTSTGLSVTTATQAMFALNAKPEVRALLNASLLGDGSGIVTTSPRQFLSDTKYIPPVPLPPSLLLMASGALALLSLAWTKRRSAGRGLPAGSAVLSSC
jgi:hypothetical protein